MGAKQTALNVLIACRKEDGWSNGILKQYIRRDGLDRRDAALATRLCCGVLQNRILLDFYLSQLLTGKVRDLHPAVRDILHLGLYQLYFTDKIPDAAAVDESVELAKHYCRGNRSAPGLVNAVLRNAIRRRDAMTEPKSWDVQYSHPQALIDLLEQSVGKQNMLAMLKENNSVPKTVVQVNLLKTTARELTDILTDGGVEAKPHEWMENCLVLSGTGSLEQLPTFRDGLFYVQDAAAALSIACMELPRGARVLDCCAAPGGKSFAAAIAMRDSGQIISCDLHEHKIGLIQKGAARLGLRSIRACQHDATQLNPEWLSQMDAVIADVPCSGYGIIRKKPDIRYKDPDSMRELPSLQLSILKTQASYVKPQGVLLYSTCTLLKRENEEVVRAFLTEHPEFTVEKPMLPEPLTADENGLLTLIPGQHHTDGFFICKMRRKA